MSLTYGFASAKDLFEKLKRDAALLEKDVSKDKFFNFVVTGWSLKDWYIADFSLSTADVKRLIESNPTLQVCRDLATASKHFQITKNLQLVVTESASSARGYGMGRYGVGEYGAGEESITLELKDGSALNCHNFVVDVLAAWERIFTAQECR